MLVAVVHVDVAVASAEFLHGDVLDAVFCNTTAHRRALGSSKEEPLKIEHLEQQQFRSILCMCL